MCLYMFKSQFVSVKRKNGHQGHDSKWGLLYQITINFNLFFNFKKIDIFNKELKVIKNNYLKFSPSSSKWVYTKIDNQ